MNKGPFSLRPNGPINKIVIDHLSVYSPENNFKFALNSITIDLSLPITLKLHIVSILSQILSILLLYYFDYILLILCSEFS